MLECELSNQVWLLNLQSKELWAFDSAQVLSWDRQRPQVSERVNVAIRLKSQVIFGGLRRWCAQNRIFSLPKQVAGRLLIQVAVVVAVDFDRYVLT